MTVFDGEGFTLTVDDGQTQVVDVEELIFDAGITDNGDGSVTVQSGGVQEDPVLIGAGATNDPDPAETTVVGKNAGTGEFGGGTAVGYGAKAGFDTVAVGKYAASGAPDDQGAGVFVGTSTNGSGSADGVAIGWTTSITGQSVAVGNTAGAGGSSAVAVGSQATASASGGVALGDAAEATGTDAVAIGNSATAPTDGQVRIGGTRGGYDRQTILAGEGPVPFSELTDGDLAVGMDRSNGQFILRGQYNDDSTGETVQVEATVAWTEVSRS